MGEAPSLAFICRHRQGGVNFLAAHVLAIAHVPAYAPATPETVVLSDVLAAVHVSRAFADQHLAYMGC